MALPDPYDCSHAELLGRHFGINLILFAHLVLSLIAILLIAWLAFISPILKRFFSLIHSNLKVVLYFGIFSFIAHSILIFALRIQSLISAFRSSPKECYYQWNTFNCLILKIPIYYCVMAFSSTHLGIFIERSIATFCFRRYSKFGYKLGVVILIFMLAITTLTVYYVYQNEEMDIPRAYCLSTTTKTASQLRVLMMIACGVDVLATIGDFIIYYANKRLKRAANFEYSLARSFQIRENQMSLHLILPLGIIHSCFFVTYLAASIALRPILVDFSSVWHIVIIELLQTAVCLYIVVIILSVIWLWKRLDREKPDWLIHPAVDPTGIYFEQFRLQMDNAYSRKVLTNNRSCLLSCLPCRRDASSTPVEILKDTS